MHDGTVNIVPTSTSQEGGYAYALEGEGVRSAICHGRVLALVGITFGEFCEVLAEVGVERGGRFDFRRKEFSPGVFDQINLDALGVAIEIEIRTFPGIERLFHLFKDDKVLEKAASQTVVH